MTMLRELPNSTQTHAIVAIARHSEHKTSLKTMFRNRSWSEVPQDRSR